LICRVGPGAYHHQPTFLSPSFNVQAKSSIHDREDLHRHPFPKQPTVPNNSPSYQKIAAMGDKGSTRAQHRQIFSATSLINQQRNDIIPEQQIQSYAMLTGGAKQPDRAIEIQNSTGAAVSALKQKNREKEAEDHTAEITLPSEPLHLSRNDVKIARKLLKGILTCTDDIMSRSGN
jgi:hypothetical protein